MASSKVDNKGTSGLPTVCRRGRIASAGAGRGSGVQ